MMTKDQKIRMGISITLLVLSVIFAVAFFVVQSGLTELDNLNVEVEGPLDAMGVTLYQFTMVVGSLYFMLLLAASGVVLALGSILVSRQLALGSILVSRQLALRLCGGGGIALHTGLLIYYFVTYGEILTAMVRAL